MVGPVRRLITATVAPAALAVPSAAGAAPATRDATVRSFDGTGIVTHFFPADGRRRPTVLPGHGYGMRGETNRDGGSEELFGMVGVKPLVDAGYNVLTWDARGFGGSGGHLRRRRGSRRRGWKEVGRSSVFRPRLGRRTIRLRVGRRLPRGQYHVRVGANAPYGRRIVVRGKRSRLRR